MPACTARSAARCLRIVVLGYLVRGPVGGMAWHHLQYVLGLRRLGHDVLFVEDSTDSEWSCYNPSTGGNGADPAYGIEFARSSFERLGMPGHWAYWNQHASQWLGPAAQSAERFCRSAELVLNLSGINPLRAWTAAIARRAYVDTDPVFTQIKHLTDPAARAAAAKHTGFFTFAENFARPTCTVPDDGFPWKPTRQPVVTSAWPVTPPPADGRFTTVMLWDSYPVREYAGRHYGMKSESFAKFRDMPHRTPAPLEIALGGSGAPEIELRSEGWGVADPLVVALRPWDYQTYIQRSAGEFSIAKHGYAVSRSGWFSERTAAYMASGRPVVVQDTGFSDWLPVGKGVFAFDSPQSAVDGLAEARGNLAAHGKAARALALEHFDSDKVLTKLVDQAMAG